MEDLVVPVPHATRRVGRVLTYRKAATLSLLFPPTGIPAMMHSLRAARLAREGEIESARHEGERARDWSWYSVGFGLSVYIVAFLAWLLLTNNHAVAQVFFGWSTMTDGGAWKSLLKGFWINVQVFLIAEVLVLVWALVVAIMRLLPGPACKPVRVLVTVYVDVFRGIPALLVILIVGLGLPQADVPFLGDFSDRNYAILALTLTYGAYVSEVYRAGIESVHWSQTAAARSLGLSYTQTMRHVVVPQAVRRVIPPLLNDFIGLQKDTALVGFLGSVEAFKQSQIDAAATFNYTPFVAAAVLFVSLTIPLARFTDWLVDRDRRRQAALGLR